MCSLTIAHARMLRLPALMTHVDSAERSKPLPTDWQVVQNRESPRPHIELQSQVKKTGAPAMDAPADGFTSR